LQAHIILAARHETMRHRCIVSWTCEVRQKIIDLLGDVPVVSCGSIHEKCASYDGRASGLNLEKSGPTRGSIFIWAAAQTAFQHGRRDGRPMPYTIS